MANNHGVSNDLHFDNRVQREAEFLKLCKVEVVNVMAASYFCFCFSGKITISTSLLKYLLQEAGTPVPREENVNVEREINFNFVVETQFQEW
jgi:hypothetical protein